MDTSASLDSWQQGGKWFTYRDHSIFCRIEGRGEPLVLIHGFPTASWDWHALWPALTERYFVIAIDLIGFGFSDKPVDYDYNVLDQADLLSGFLRELGVQQCDVICHDFGVSVAQELLARQLEQTHDCEIKSVCFLNGGLFPETHQPVFIQRLLSSAFGGIVSRFITRSTYEKAMCRLFGAANQPDQELLQNFWDLIKYNNGLGLIHRLVRYIEERRCHRNRWVSALQKTPTPMRFINGLEDPVSGRDMADRYEYMVENGDVVRLEGVGHYPHIETPQRVLSTYLDFRQSIDT
ncbi:alpha/beta fold hydrolase [Alkalimarinus sediminis]|uniref:Alpha/beta hydrolase n=1 Tax=Alkalimarinus sediminis TaxID=1632866 RepID=A0A9E8HL77_9ALTE|nr:alpha/beta hydrolase [Alkalimarinus sediminis]UZW74748.1 alpha/beta hydrolase [Alkalimarinus sediminis]